MGRLLLLAFACLILGCQNDNELNFRLTIKKISDSQALLEWNKVPSSDSYIVWRVIVKNGVLYDASIIETLDVLTPQYIDENLPVQAEAMYFVTTNSNDKELKSNSVTIYGRSTINILPYQMSLVPESNIAVIRGYNMIYLFDYTKGLLLKTKAFNEKVGAFGHATFNGKYEIYVPGSSGKLYILDANNLDELHVITTGSTLESAAANSIGWIAVSGSNPVSLYNRESLNLIGGTTGETNMGLMFRSNYELISISKHISPAKMSLYKLSFEGGFISQTNDPYNWDYEMESTRFDVSDRYIVTSTEGFIYNADQTLAHVGTITGGGNNQMDFEFSSDGTTIYSALTNHNSILRTTIHGGTVKAMGQINTKGYPWILARNGDKMVVISSPTSYSPYNLTGLVFIEVVSLN